MLERQTSPDGIATYVSPLLRQAGVPHAFSTRIGGKSPKPFDSMNLGNPSGCEIQDTSERIRENYRMLLSAVALGGRELVWVHQVHGGRVLRVRAGEEHDNNAKADALVGDDPARVLSVRIADCVPVLLAGEDGSVVAAVHAGWRGVVAGIALEAIREMNGVRDLPARRLIAAIGPAIGFDAFEVGGEVLDEFRRAFGQDAPVRVVENGKGRVDLREALRRQLLEAGLQPERIDDTDRCTYRDADEFFSHRRDKGISGRMAAVIAPVGPQRHRG